MSGSVLLDINILIALFAADLVVLVRLATSHGVFVPAVAIGELYYGAVRSSKPEKNIARIEAFTETAAEIACDVGTA